MITSVMRNACRISVAILVIAGAYAVGSAQQRCPDGQYLAKYYKNTTLSGQPTLTRCESRINHDWGQGGPGGGGSSASDGKSDGGSTRRSVGSDHFSVRWEGRYNFAGGDVTFVATADDGIRVWVDGELIINDWQVRGVKQFRATRNLTPGIHTVKVEYFEKDGGAVARVRW